MDFEEMKLAYLRATHPTIGTAKWYVTVANQASKSATTWERIAGQLAEAIRNMEPNNKQSWHNAYVALMNYEGEHRDN